MNTTLETVIEAVFNPTEMSDDVLIQAAKEFSKLSPDAKEIYLDELKRKSLERDE